MMSKFILLLSCFNIILFAFTGKVNGLKLDNETITGLSAIINALPSNSITIFVMNKSEIDNVDKFISKIQLLPKTTNLFYDSDSYVEHLDKNLKGSIDITTIILSNIEDFIDEIRMNNLAHRLSLFVFYWGIKNLPKRYYFEDPLRVVIITHPKINLFRIYYNQAVSNSNGLMRLVNFVDTNEVDIVLHTQPIFPSTVDVFKNFNGKVLYIPVIHSPPWYFVKYSNESIDMDDLPTNLLFENGSSMQSNTLQVIGGRDDNLIKILSKKMNFKFEYIDPPERTQGSVTDAMDNNSFSGGLGMLQRREANMFLGDIAISWERKQAVEFSVFTLADSGAFVTHSPHVLNEALALVRPFRMNVWPALIITIILSGPILYLIIVISNRWTRKLKTQREPFYRQYVNEITGPVRKSQLKFIQKKKSENLLFNCVWFTLAVFLRQSGNIPYRSNRIRFLAIILWLAATYVLGDVYSAQLTSQLARPAKEPPINNLYRLKNAMFSKGYKLYVERQSASLAVLENGTGIFGELYTMMKRQSSTTESYLVPSVEDGIRMIANDYKTVIFGGRETLYFNIRKHGMKNFQLSEKLYTRYSAIAVQYGCPFLESLNLNILRLYEASILDKITNNEYERMVYSTFMDEDENVLDNQHENRKMNQEIAQPTLLQPINLKMLQGAFYTLFIGYIISGVVLLFEFESKRQCGSTIYRFIQRNWNKLLAKTQVLKEILNEIF